MVCCTDLFSKRISFRLHSTKQVYAQKEDCFFRLLSDERTASAFIRLAFRALTLASVSEMDSFAFALSPSNGIAWSVGFMSSRGLDPSTLKEFIF